MMDQGMLIGRGVVESVVFATALLIMLVVGFGFWRHPATRWFEQRQPRLFPSRLVRNMEAIAVERPLNYFALQFLALLGAFGLAQDFGGPDWSLAFKYGMAAMVAGFALVMARHSASQREEPSTTHVAAAAHPGLSRLTLCVAPALLFATLCCVAGPLLYWRVAAEPGYAPSDRAREVLLVLPILVLPLFAFLFAVSVVVHRSVRPEGEFPIARLIGLVAAAFVPFFIVTYVLL